MSYQELNELIRAYTVLGISVNATQPEILQAKRKMLQKHHPDKHTSFSQETAQRMFNDIQVAYERICDKSHLINELKDSTLTNRLPRSLKRPLIYTEIASLNGD